MIFFRDCDRISLQSLSASRGTTTHELTTTIMLWCDNVIMWIGWMSWTNYKVRPIVIPIILDSVQDFQRLEHAAQSTKRYLFRFVSFFLINNHFVPVCKSLFMFANILIISLINHMICQCINDNSTCLTKRFVWMNSLHQQHLTTMFFSSVRTQRGDTQMGFGLTTSFLMACHTYVIVPIVLRETGIIQFWNQLHFQYHLFFIPSYYSVQILRKIIDQHSGTCFIFASIWLAFVPW